MNFSRQINEWARKTNEALLPIEDQADNMVLFWGCGPKTKIQKGCFSQWWKCRFKVDGVMYNCAEQYMMAMKAKTFNDAENLEKIIASSNPKEIKRLGRLVKNFDPSTWDSVKFDIVVKGNHAKFSQDTRLKDFLLSTGDKIIAEASPKDKIWGIGLTEEDPDAWNQKTWKGQNLLGKALMVVRDMLKSGKLLTEDYIISDNFHNRYWSRAQDFEVEKPSDFTNVSFLKPIFLSLHPARTIWYANDKKDYQPYVVIVELNPSEKICDLTDKKDIKTLGFPPSITKSFQEIEPYFSFSTKTYKNKDSNMVSAELKIAAFVIKGLAKLAKVKGSSGKFSIPDFLSNPDKAIKIFGMYYNISQQANVKDRSIWPIYIGLQEFLGDSSLRPNDEEYVESASVLFNNLADKFDKNPKQTKLSREDLQQLVKVRAYLRTFLSLVGELHSSILTAKKVIVDREELSDSEVEKLKKDVISGYIEDLQASLHRRMLKAGYCGYYCREKGRSRPYGTNDKMYKTLCLFDTKAIVSVKTVQTNMFQQAYQKLRKSKHAGSIKGKKDEVYEDIITYIDNYFEEPLTFNYSCTLYYRLRGSLRKQDFTGQTITVKRKIARDIDTIRSEIKTIILKKLKSMDREIVPQTLKTSDIKQVQGRNDLIGDLIKHKPQTIDFIN